MTDWRSILGPELSERLIAQAWDDIARGLHREGLYRHWQGVRHSYKGVPMMLALRTEER